MFEITFNYDDKYKDGRVYINIHSDESIITDEIRKSINKQHKTRNQKIETYY